MKTIKLNYEGVEFVNRDGNKAKADFREVDAKGAFLAQQEENLLDTDEGGEKPVRVDRVSEKGRRLIGRFYGSSKREDAEDFVELMNENYSTLGYYTAEIRE